MPKKKKTKAHHIAAGEICHTSTPNGRMKSVSHRKGSPAFIQRHNIVKICADGESELHTLTDSKQCLQASEKWFARANNTKTARSGYTVHLYSKLAMKCAKKAYLLEGRRYEQDGVLNNLFFTAAYQKLKTYVLVVKSFGRHDVNQMLLHNPKADALHSVEFIKNSLQSIIELVFDAQKFKIAFDKNFTLITKMVTPNEFQTIKDRHAKNCLNQFSQLIIYIKRIDSIPFALESIHQLIKKAQLADIHKSNLLPAMTTARTLFLHTIRDTTQTLKDVLKNSAPKSSLFQELNSLGFFAQADDFGSRVEGATGQQYTSDINDLIVAYTI